MKSLFKSKTFWFNVLTAGASVTGVLPEKYALPVAAVVNIGLRLVTNQGVGVLVGLE